MKQWIAFWNIMLKDVRTYYLKPPNLSWGLIFPLAWTGMFFIKTGRGMESLAGVLPGVVAVSILFGTTSMLAVTVTFEKKTRSFERLLLAPVLLAAWLTDLVHVAWSTFALATVMIAVASTFQGLFIAVAVSEVFEAQTFSNFFRFPMIFLCGLFVPVASLPWLLRPLSWALPLTYGADILHGAVTGSHALPLVLDFLALGAFCVALFMASLYNIRRKWIV